jgi:uncharacterized iron-regulated membrane protein
MKLFRRAIFWAHLVAGVSAGIVIFIMSVTGVMLTYEKQFISLADKFNAAIEEPAGAQALSPAELLASLGESGISQTPSSLIIRADAEAPVEASFGRERVVLLNPYSGKVIADGMPGARNFFKKTRDFHRWLAMSGDGRDTGKAITGASNLLFLFLVVSGFYLWWPRNWSWSTLRNVTWFRRGLSGKKRDFNWHNTIGFWCAVPLFFVVISGVVISYGWAGNLVYKIAGENPPERRQGAIQAGSAPRSGREAKQEKRGDATNSATSGEDMGELNEWFSRAQAQVPAWRSISVGIPAGAGSPVQLTADEGTGGQPQKKTKISFKTGSAEPPKVEQFSDGSAGSRLRSYLRFLHTGEVLGLFGQTVAGIASAGAALLVWTGFALGLRRLRRRWSGA